MNLVQAVLRRREETDDETRMTVDDYIELVNEWSFNGVWYGSSGVQQSIGAEPAERIAHDFVGYATSAYQSNGIVFACMLVRQLIFSAVRFQYQRLRSGRPSELWSDQTLALLERPWPGGTTQDLLARMINDADLAGNNYLITDTPLPRIGGDGTEIVRLRPDWVGIVLEDREIRGGVVGQRKVGYVYQEGGFVGEGTPVPFLADEVAHFAPNVDPLAKYRGMSWLTPIIREVQADKLMTAHKRKFFENAATPNMVIKHDKDTGIEQILAFKARLDAEHKGADHAYKTLHLGGGADATVVGASFQQMDFKSIQGGGETRVCANAGVPVVIVGLSEGLQGSSLNAGNYGQARRRLADGTMHPLWGNAAGSLEMIRPAPPSQFAGGTVSRLMYDARDVPFLREDEKDAAEIAFMEAQTMRQLVDAGYTPESVQRAVLSGDYGLLVHSGLFSVQLQAAGSQPLASSDNGNRPAITAGAST